MWGATAALELESREFDREVHIATGTAELINQEYLGQAGTSGGGPNTQQAKQ